MQVSPACLPLSANFRPIIRCNKWAKGRVTFTLIVCTQRGSLPPHHGSKVSSIVSNFLLPFLATVCCFFSLSEPDPNNLGHKILQHWTPLWVTAVTRPSLTSRASMGGQVGDLWVQEEMREDAWSESLHSQYRVSSEKSGFHCFTVSGGVQIWQNASSPFPVSAPTDGKWSSLSCWDYGDLGFPKINLLGVKQTTAHSWPNIKVKAAALNFSLKRFVPNISPAVSYCPGWLMHCNRVSGSFAVAQAGKYHMSQSKTNLISPLYCEQLTQHMSAMNHTDTFEGKIKGNK